MNLIYDLHKDEAACRAIHKFVFPQAEYWKAYESHKKLSVSIVSKRPRSGGKVYDISIHYDGHMYFFMGNPPYEENYLDANYFHLIDFIRELGYTIAPKINFS